MDDLVYYNNFEDHLREELIRVCRQNGALTGQLLRSEDIDLRWTDYAPDYMADAMKLITDYPTVSVAWAGYLGMAVAKWWDQDWETFRYYPYGRLHGKRGFDDMDEHIVQHILGIPLESEEATRMEDLLRSLATTAIGFIRHENIEPQSPQAFYVYARTVKVMYQIGASLELERLGYRWKGIMEH